MYLAKTKALISFTVTYLFYLCIYLFIYYICRYFGKLIPVFPSMIVESSNTANI